jgi:phage protein D
MEARRTSIELIYQGKNITDDIAPDLISFSYTDNASEESDDVSINLKNDHGRWINEWAPIKGDIIKPTIICDNWSKDGEKQKLFCGTFIVDEPTFSGPPDTVSIGAIAAPSNTNFMDTLQHRTWKKASVYKIAETLAKASGLRLEYDTKDNPIIGFIEQSNETDAAFLLKVCQDYGLQVKLFNKTIVIFSEAEYEAVDPVVTISKNGDDGTIKMISYSAKTTFAESGFDGCQIKYTHHKKGTTCKYTFWRPGIAKKKTGLKVYKINEKAESYAEAQRLAKSKLRELNKKEDTISITIPGNAPLSSTQTVLIQGLGKYDGKYYLEKVGHSIGGAYQMTIDAHRCLEGY